MRNNYIYILTTILMFFVGCKSSDLTEVQVKDLEIMKGSWSDDYTIDYKINDKTWEMGNKILFHILEWNENKNFIIVENDTSNEFNAGQFSRIDYIFIDDMDPYEWAFCITAYDQETADGARNSPAADGDNPMKGCNGFPFSRMKRK